MGRSWDASIATPQRDHADDGDEFVVGNLVQRLQRRDPFFRIAGFDDRYQKVAGEEQRHDLRRSESVVGNP